VRENFDRPEVLVQVQAMFEELGNAEAGAAVIEREKSAIIRTNNEGVMLAKNGRFDEAQAMLQQAAEELPNNLTVQLNVIQATLMQMEKLGVTNQTRYLANEHLGIATRLAPRSPKVQKMRQALAPYLAAPKQERISA
jgi:tetratricopeptide (TPR) repeat protein